MKDSVEILIIYRSRFGREATYTSIVAKEDDIDLEDYEGKRFWQTMGGLQIAKDEYNIILNCTSFYNVVKATSFLLHTLYTIKGIPCHWFDINEENPSEVRVMTMAEDVLSFHLIDINNIKISFLPVKEEMANIRGRYYFSEITMSTIEWVNASCLALEEYFFVLAKTLDSAKGTKLNSIMKEYISIYKQINPTSSL